MAQTPAVMNLLIANAIAYLAMILFDSEILEIYALFALFPVESPFFEWWQPVTYMFMHGGFTHLFFNMFALWMFGRIVEYDLGSKRFLTYYLVCGVGAGIIQLLVNYLEFGGLPFPVVTVGASGAVFGLLLAYGMMHPNNVVMLMFPPIALKAKWFVVVYGVLELMGGVAPSGSNVAHFAHLGGMLFGFLLLRYWKRKNMIWY
jgi:membrane associated rhomboid family serine protease